MSTRVLYLDASAGVSGDMFVGALIGVGADPRVIRKHVTGLGVPGLDVRVAGVSRGGVAATKFDVIDPDTGCNVDQPSPANGAGPRPQPHRGLGEVLRIIRGGALPEPVAGHAEAVFELLGRAEAKVHGVDPDQVHFHEVGALDAIADVVAAASAFEQLGVERAWCSPVHVGCGTVRCAHGVLPVPAPATAEILQGVPVYSDGVQGELCTPTGAALVRHFCAGFGDAPPMEVEAVGNGAGSKDFGIPNVLRATLGREPGVRDEG